MSLQPCIRILLCVLIFFCFFFCVFEFQSKWFWHLLWKEFNVKIHFYQPNSQSLIVWMGPSTLHTPNPVNLVSFTGSCVESEMQRDVFFSSGAFQAFDQDGDGTIRLSVLEVRATTACQLWGRSTKTWIRFRGVKSKVLKYKVVKYLEFVPYWGTFIHVSLLVIRHSRAFCSLPDSRN